MIDIAGGIILGVLGLIALAFLSKVVFAIIIGTWEWIDDRLNR